MEGYEVLVLSAEGDGVAPSLIVSPIPPLKGPQYLFNCPEGFARLAIEHKVRPSGKLAAVFLTSLLPQAAAGLPGLFLRLAVDGHEKIETCGPTGTAAYVHAQRHIVHWVHPRVTVDQAVLNPPQKPIFQDGRVSVVPILVGSQEVACPCCLDGEVSAGLGRVSGLGQDKPEEKPAVVLDLGSSESESESDSEGERGATKVAGQTAGKDDWIAPGAPIERRGELPEASAVERGGREEPGRGEKKGTGLQKVEELVEAAVVVTPSRRDSRRSEDREAGPEGVAGGTVIREEGTLAQTLEAEVGDRRNCGEQDPGSGEATAAVDLESGQSQRSDMAKAPLPTVDLSSSSSEASDSSESSSESEKETAGVKKPARGSRMPQNDDGVQRRLNLQTARRGLRPERVAMFAQLDSIFGGAGVGAPMEFRHLALSTLTGRPALLGGPSVGSTKNSPPEHSPPKNSPQKKRAHNREKVISGEGEAAKVGGKREAKTAGEGLGFKRRRKVVEITSSGGEAFSMDESVEVELTRVRSDAGLTLPADDADEVRQPVEANTGTEGPARKTIGTAHQADFAEGAAVAEESSEDDGECLTQLLSPKGGSKRRRGVGGEAREALFAQLDDIFISEGDANNARNKALQHLGGQPTLAGEFGGVGKREKSATGRESSGDVVTGLGDKEPVNEPGARNERAEHPGLAQRVEYSAARTTVSSGLGNGGQLAVERTEAAAAVESLREGLVGSARLRGGAPRNDKWGRRGVPYWATNDPSPGGGSGVPNQGRGHFGGAGGQGQSARAPPWKNAKRFFGHQDSNSEDSDTWREEAMESGMDWLLRSSSGRKARRARKGLPPGTGGATPPGTSLASPAGGGTALAGGVAPRPQPRVQIDTHAPSTNPVFLRTAAGAVPIEEGLEGLGRDATASKGALLGYLAIFGPPVNGSVFVVDCREEATCAQLTSIRFPTCVGKGRGAHRLVAVFHFTPADVAACQPYKKWLGSFGPHVRHMMLADADASIGYRATYGTLARLNLVDASIFPLAGNANGTGRAEARVSDGGKEAITGPASETGGHSPLGAEPGLDAKNRGSEPGSLGLLARVILRSRRPGSDAPAEVDESRCLGGVNVEGIQSRVLTDQPALAFWRSGGKLEDYKAGTAGGRLQQGCEGGWDGGSDRKWNGKETGDGGAERSSEVLAKQSERQVKRADEPTMPGVAPTAAASGVERGAVASGIARNSAQAELQFERQLAEQAAALQAHWHVLSPTLNKAHCGSAKPGPIPKPTPGSSRPQPSPGNLQPGPTTIQANRDLNRDSYRTRTGLQRNSTPSVSGTAKRNCEGLEGPEITGPLPQLLFLGTGSAEPSKYRGGSAILLNLTPHAGLMMDCGEGAAGQLLRIAGLVPSAGFGGLGNEDGRARAVRVARTIRVLWVSHKHADHCLGVLGVLQLRGGDEPQLLVLGPVAVQRWLEEVAAAMQESGHTLPPYIFRHCRELGSLLETANKQPWIPVNQPPNPGLTQGLSPGPTPSQTQGFHQGPNPSPNQGYNPEPNQALTQGFDGGPNQSFRSGPNQGFNPGPNRGLNQGFNPNRVDLGLSTGHPSSPRDWQRPSFGQPSRASHLGSEQQDRPETFLGGQQQRFAGGDRQQGYQNVEQGYFQQQYPGQSGAFQSLYAHVQPAPNIAHTVDPSHTAQRQPFDPQTQFFSPPRAAPFPTGPFAPNQYIQRPGQAPGANQFQHSLSSAFPSSSSPGNMHSGASKQPGLNSAPNPTNVAAQVDPPKPPNSANPSGAADACTALNLVRAQAVPVHHCADSWGLVVHHRDGWSLVYSGDTRPTRPLIEAGRGCTLLIHEATFEGKLLDHARRKRHSTTEEALDAAAQMRAQRTILTHFSQRYPKAVEFASNLPAADSTCIAFDGMVVPFSELGRLPSLLQPIRLALADVERTEAEQGA